MGERVVARFLWILMTAVTGALLALSGGAYAQANDEKPAKVKREVKPCRDEQGELLPLFKLYEVAGRKWTTKRVTNPNAPGGDRFDMYSCYEVLEVQTDHALIRQTALDQSRKPTKDKPIDGTLKFDSEISPFKMQAGFIKTKDETITVPGGKFDCEAYAGGFDNAKVWRSKDYSGLVVRHSDDYGTTEIFEFERFDSDKAPAKKSAVVKEGEPDFSLYKAKRSWLMQTTIVKGGLNFVSFRKHDVTKADATSCELKITELNDSKKPIKEKPAEVKAISFTREFNDWVEPPLGVTKLRLEKRKAAGTAFSCTVYRLKDDQGREVILWFSRDYPGLTVRRVVGDEGKDGVSELVEFK